jgi:2-oxoglutarate dehydrogenase E1 component
VREGYLDHLLKYGGVTREQAEEIASAHRNHLERELAVAKQTDYRLTAERPRGVWIEFIGGPDKDVPEVATGVALPKLAELLDAQTRYPESFKPHLKIKKFLEHRREMASGKVPLDWTAAEALAFATLAVANHPVRLTGQDVERGTFSQRHAVLHDFDTGRTVRSAAPSRAESGGQSRFATLHCRRSACSASSMATVSIGPSRSSGGKRSSAISGTWRR